VKLAAFAWPERGGAFRQKSNVRQRYTRTRAVCTHSIELIAVEFVAE
jgi:hypothetical protein